MFKLTKEFFVKNYRNSNNYVFMNNASERISY